MEQSKFYQIKNITEQEYTLVGCDGSVITRPIQDLDKSASAFTIQDAKDGNVLVCPHPKGYEGKDQIFMFKCINSREYVDCIEYYCRVCEGVFYENKNGYIGTTFSPLYPANKEQRDLLFQKMKEAGYEWDAINLKLNRISQRIVSAEAKEVMYDKPKWNVSDFRTWQYIVSDVLTKKDGIGQYLDSGECKKIAKYMQEEWSKKLSVEQRTTELPKSQDYGIDGLYAAIDILTKTLGEVDGYQSDDGILEHKCAISAVKELSEQKPDWSEEDEEMYKEVLTNIIYAKNDLKVKECLGLSKRAMKAFNWFSKRYKSLKPQSRWKPSEEQMKALSNINLTGSISYVGQGQELINLYSDLKKLKG